VYIELVHTPGAKASDLGVHKLLASKEQDVHVCGHGVGVSGLFELHVYISIAWSLKTISKRDDLLLAGPEMLLYHEKRICAPLITNLSPLRL